MFFPPTGFNLEQILIIEKVTGVRLRLVNSSLVPAVRGQSRIGDPGPGGVELFAFHLKLNRGVTGRGERLGQGPLLQ